MAHESKSITIVDLSSHHHRPCPCVCQSATQYTMLAFSAHDETKPTFHELMYSDCNYGDFTACLGDDYQLTSSMPAPPPVMNFMPAGRLPVAARPTSAISACHAVQITPQLNTKPPSTLKSRFPPPPPQKLRPNRRSETTLVVL